jgi:formyltetrahydrofolate-dependent phosphoribosylglycinamide formyltransferase
MKTAKPKLLVFISGGGRTLLNIHDRTLDGSLPAEIKLVVASRACLGEERASQRGLPTLIVPGTLTSADLIELVRLHDIELVVLAGYLRLMPVPPELEGRMVNIHPSLLPKYGGAGMYGHHVHEAVLAAGDDESGCTVHLCTPEYDRGRILVQRRCPVIKGDTPTTLAARVFEQELLALPEAISLLLKERGRI